MAYIYRKRSKNQQILSGVGKICPGCKSNKLELTEPGKDRTTFTCKKCGSISTFTDAPYTSKTKKEAPKKLSAITLRDKSDTHVESPRQRPLHNEPIANVLEVIRKSMKDKLILSFDYIASDAKKSSRNIEPYKITNKNGEVVLFGYDLENGGIRTFKLGKMSYVENQSYGYEPRYAVEDKLKEKDE